ncbi:hypothetical protein AVEN_92560-1 [Araneus ventricosus]|uniref:Uncharacterized protein n=1 Tax=Araneus ventricosus TaxID=182803 RepID=A0A4Y2AJE8_ARAVE|nr:hypothetical protein AVEN_92560-1 [Araneus ventricosus]
MPLKIICVNDALTPLSLEKQKCLPEVRCRSRKSEVSDRNTITVPLLDKLPLIWKLPSKSCPSPDHLNNRRQDIKTETEGGVLMTNTGLGRPLLQEVGLVIEVEATKPHTVIVPSRLLILRLLIPISEVPHPPTVGPILR